MAESPGGHPGQGPGRPPSPPGPGPRPERPGPPPGPGPGPERPSPPPGGVPGEGGGIRGRPESTKGGKAIRREEKRRRDENDREVLDIIVWAEGLPGRVRHQVMHPEHLTDEMRGWIHADLERMLDLAEEHGRIGALGPLLEGAELDWETGEPINDAPAN